MNEEEIVKIIANRLNSIDDPEYNIRLMRHEQVKKIYQASLFNENNIDPVPLNEYKVPDLQNKELYEKIYKEVVKYTTKLLQSEQKNNLLLYGKAGTGKTYLAKSLMKLLYKEDFKVLFLNMLSLKDLAYRFDNESKDRIGILKNYAEKVDLLIIDDLGSESNNKVAQMKEATETIQQLLYEFSNIRVGRPTLITTNLSKDAIYQTYNEKLVSRIFPKNPQYIFNFDMFADLRNR